DRAGAIVLRGIVGGLAGLSDPDGLDGDLGLYAGGRFAGRLFPADVLRSLGSSRAVVGAARAGGPAALGRALRCEGRVLIAAVVAEVGGDGELLALGGEVVAVERVVVEDDGDIDHACDALDLR